MTFDAVLFDLDGTLADTRADIAASANAAREAVGLPALPEPVVTSMVGAGARNLVTRALGQEHAHLFEPALAAFFAFYEAHLVVHAQLYPGIEALLARLAVPAAICTNKPGRFARPIAQQLGIASRFITIQGDDDGLPRKPDPAGALALAAQLGVAPARIAFVGDSQIDGQTARRAGMPFIAVTWGYGPFEELQACAPHAVAHHAGDLAHALGLPR